MNDLQERLRRFADEGARQARPPGAEAALRRGRRRQRRQLGAAALALAALLAGGLGIRGQRGPLPVHPLAPGPTVTSAGPPVTGAGPPVTRVGPPVTGTGRAPVSLPREFEPIPGQVIAHGDRPGYRWRLVARRTRLPQDQWEVTLVFQRDDYGPPNADLVALEPVTLSLLTPSIRDQDPVAAGVVTRRAARVRLWLHRGGTQLPPVDVPVIDGGRDFPEDFFLVFVPKGGLLRNLVLLDRAGRQVCHQRFVDRSGEDQLPVTDAGACF
jgi:hypothetical protein